MGVASDYYHCLVHYYHEPPSHKQTNKFTAALPVLLHYATLTPTNNKIIILLIVNTSYSAPSPDEQYRFTTVAYDNITIFLKDYCTTIVRRTSTSRASNDR